MRLYRWCLTSKIQFLKLATVFVDVSMTNFHITALAHWIAVCTLITENIVFYFLLNLFFSHFLLFRRSGFLDCSLSFCFHLFPFCFFICERWNDGIWGRMMNAKNNVRHGRLAICYLFLFHNAFAKIQWEKRCTFTEYITSGKMTMEFSMIRVQPFRVHAIHGNYCDSQFNWRHSHTNSK